MALTKKYKSHIKRTILILVFLFVMIFVIIWGHQKTEQWCDVTNDFVLDSFFHLLHAFTVPLFALNVYFIYGAIKHSKFEGNKYKKTKKKRHE